MTNLVRKLKFFALLFFFCVLLPTSESMRGSPNVQDIQQYTTPNGFLDLLLSLTQKDDKVLNLTKHIIKSGHVRLLKNINGKIPLNWIVIDVTSQDDLFKHYCNLNKVQNAAKNLSTRISELPITPIHRLQLSKSLNSCRLDVVSILECIKRINTLTSVVHDTVPISCYIDLIDDCISKVSSLQLIYKTLNDKHEFADDQSQKQVSKLENEIVQNVHQLRQDISKIPNNFEIDDIFLMKSVFPSTIRKYLEEYRLYLLDVHLNQTITYEERNQVASVVLDQAMSKTDFTQLVRKVIQSDQLAPPDQDVFIKTVLSANTDDYFFSTFFPHS